MRLRFPRRTYPHSGARGDRSGNPLGNTGTCQEQTVNPLSDQTRSLLEHVSTATLTTQMFRRGFRNIFMKGVAPLGKLENGNMVGPAFTLRNIPAREDIDVLEIFLNPDNPQRKGIESVPPGYVLVQDCRGDKTAASCGSILTTRLKVRGVAGMVSDGPVRDSGVIAALGFPVF